ncbi:hypothetical protein [Escherichia coli]|uniref:hypothetical protein n=1 Tax=Escherichia coli TaxID=562 RepID=UPI0024E0C0CD|nr:hypothetical protein [Escherichia coli]
MKAKFQRPLNKAKKLTATLYSATLKAQEIKALFDLDVFPECPNQRPTEYRCNRRDHLKGRARIGQEVITMGFCVSDGRMYMLDGNSRRHNWASGALEMPQIVVVMIHVFPNIQALNDAYYNFDNKHSMMTPAEIVAGANRVAGIDSNCWLLKGGTGERACAAVAIGLFGNYNELTKEAGNAEVFTAEMKQAFNWIDNACKDVEPESMRAGNAKFWTVPVKAALYACVHDALKSNDYAMLDYWLEVIQSGRDHDVIRGLEIDVRKQYEGRDGRNVQEAAMFCIINHAKSAC